MSRWILALSLAAISSVAAPVATAESPKASSMNVTLPQSLRGWTVSGPANKIEPKAIFNYMDGAGELYLGYRFKFLEVYEYKNPSQDDILVELYWMESSDDAYGLLSGDWGGEAVNLAASSQPSALAVRALYGAGLLRIWSDNLYARVMTYQETDASRKAVLELGKAIVRGRSEPMVPRLVSVLPESVAAQFRLRPDRTVYLRSHLVLNSVYFLSSENLLDVGLDCELVAAAYRRGSGSGSSGQVRLFLVQYPDEDSARRALSHFQKVYLSGKTKLSTTHDQAIVSIEDGWAGFVLSKRRIGLVFEAPDESSTRLFLKSAKQAVENLETAHE